MQVDQDTLELTFEPIEDPMIGRVGDTLIVGYLTYDYSCENPFTSCDEMGELVTETKEVESYLGLGYYGEVDIDREFNVSGQTVTLRQLAERHYEGTEVHPETLEGFALDLYPDYAQEIMGPYVLPVRNYGGTFETYTWDGRGRYPRMVWVADEGSKVNIDEIAKRKGIPPIQAAYGYADAILKVYSTWAQGQNYGAVIDKLKWDGQRWRVVDNDSCWGFIGQESAEEYLKSQFEAEVKLI